jgi:ribulose-phosphate 3-epimerase
MARLPLDVHLMIMAPDRLIPVFVEAGSDIITVHVETCLHLEGTISTIKKLGVKAGVVLNPATPLVCLEHILDQLDMVLLMSVNPGFSGQEFLPAMLPKIEELKNRIDKAGLDVDLEVDGGINPGNCKSVVDAGANVLVAGSAVFKSNDYNSAINKLKGDS